MELKPYPFTYWDFNKNQNQFLTDGNLWIEMGLHPYLQQVEKTYPVSSVDPKRNATCAFIQTVQRGVFRVLHIFSFLYFSLCSHPPYLLLSASVICRETERWRWRILVPLLLQTQLFPVSFSLFLFLPSEVQAQIQTVAFSSLKIHGKE